jgi:hypothetical protein
VVEIGTVPLTLKQLEQDLDRPPAGQPGAPSRLLSHAELKKPGAASLRQDIGRLCDHVNFYTPAGDGTFETFTRGNHKLTASRNRRRTPSGDYSCENYSVVFLKPAARGLDRSAAGWPLRLHSIHERFPFWSIGQYGILVMAHSGASACKSSSVVFVRAVFGGAT